MAHLLVTGGAGYVGAHALRALRAAGHSALVVDDLRAGHAAFVEGTPLRRHDVGDRAELARSFDRFGPFDAVLHFAASPAASESPGDPLRCYRGHVEVSLALIETALARGVRAFVLCSSATVYGAARLQPVPESTPPAPTSPHGASKAIVERMLADVERAHGMRWAALRCFNACGADPSGGIGELHAPETHLIPAALETAYGLRATLRLHGSDYATRDGSCVRDYVHVSDLADAHLRVLEGLLDGGPGGAYNVGTGEGHSSREVVEAVQRVTGRPVPLEQGQRRDGDPPELVADGSRFRRDFGWTPRHSDLDTIVATAAAWLRHHHGL